jgi:dihydrofolate synthase/folylpolyglutamate synthase
VEFASYAEALTHIHSLPRLKRSNTRAELRAALAHLGHPERQGHFIHVTGTNGKGSTSNAIAHILQASGATVGLFTSPFIMRFNERIQIDGRPVSDEDIRRAAGQVQTAIDDLRVQEQAFALKEFEFVTCMCFLIFADRGVDLAVIEVGIGGTHDSTNVIMPEVSVLINVALDHTDILGDTVAEIAHEKAGIIKPGVAVVIGKLPEDARREVIARVQTVGAASLAEFGQDFTATGTPDAQSFSEHLVYRDADGKLSGLEFPLIGSYQAQNAAVAIQASKQMAQRLQLPLTNADIKRGLAAASWPVRMERISAEPLIVLDGAHNPNGIAAALSTLRRVQADSVTLIVGILADKAMGQMLAQLADFGARVILVPVPNNPRAATAADYKAAGASDWPVMDWHEALAYTLHEEPDSMIVIMGSLYLASAVRQELLGDSTTEK